jgi:hypothetical protein
MSVTPVRSYTGIAIAIVIAAVVISAGLFASSAAMRTVTKTTTQFATAVSTVVQIQSVTQTVTVTNTSGGSSGSGSNPVPTAIWLTVAAGSRSGTLEVSVWNNGGGPMIAIVVTYPTAAGSTLKDQGDDTCLASVTDTAIGSV